MRATAVTPIAKPITALRKFGLVMRPNAGLEGCSSKAVTLAAAIIKIPSNAPSMRYSGQCDCSDCFIFAHALLRSPGERVETWELGYTESRTRRRETLRAG